MIEKKLEVQTEEALSRVRFQKGRRILKRLMGDTEHNKVYVGNSKAAEDYLQEFMREVENTCSYRIGGVYGVKTSIANGFLRISSER